jgi:hypothetical protein
MPQPRFSLGEVVATPGALEALQAAGQDAAHFLTLHQSGAWGDIDREDCQLNDSAIAHEGDLDQQQRVLSAYQTALHKRIWIITEWDRSVTTILLPDEY